MNRFQALKSDDFFEVVRHIRLEVDSFYLNIVFLDFGGLKIKNAFCGALKKHGFVFNCYMLKHADRFENGYRPIVGIRRNITKDNSPIILPENIKVPKSRYLIIVDDNIHFGHSLIGGLVYSIENRDYLGKFEKIFVIVDHDELGTVAHFARRRFYHQSINLHDLFRKLSPKKYNDFKNKGLLRFT